MPSWDSKFRFQSVTPINHDPTQLNNEDEYVSFSNKRVFKQRFGFDLELKPQGDASGMEYFTFVSSLGGRYQVFDFPNPMKKLGNASPSLVCRAVNAVGKGSNQILVDGLQANIDGQIVVGEFIRPIANRKGYLVESVTPVDANGRMTLTVYPRLYNAISGNEVIQIAEQVVFQMRMVSDKNDLMFALAGAFKPRPKLEVIEAESV